MKTTLFRIGLLTLLLVACDKQQPAASEAPKRPSLAERREAKRKEIRVPEDPGTQQFASVHSCQCGNALPCYSFRGPCHFAMPSTFHTSTPLSASPEVMFAFHSDPSNLPQVMPPTLTLVSLKTDGPAQEGRLIELHCRDWWIIPMRWTCRWKTVQPPHLLVDEIVKGPFTLFVHEHRFEGQGTDRCVMHDTITYQWGRSWWGRLVSETGVRLYLTLLFKYRHHRTRKWAEAV